ncbi:MAG: hypothetical protein ACRD3M_13445 [Thermoanaerobaculia bacterium]
MLLAVVLVVPLATEAARGQDLPFYLRDRGTGVATSMFGTYVRKGELLAYPYFEYYADSNLEYKPSELGYEGDEDYRGRYRAYEFLHFLGYGITRNLAVELEAAYISARLEKDPSDPSSMPDVVQESGLGDVEAQLRWRWLEENERRPEAFMYFETVFPFQKNRSLIGTRDWEFALGFGVTKGFRWGTMTLRATVAYTLEENEVDAGEYAIEYLKRLSPKWRVVALIEGHQLDEVSLITEIQWQFHPRAFLKINNGWGLTPNATDFAPEIGVMISF